MGKRKAGTCFIKVDAEQLEVSGGVEAPINDVKREPILGATGVVGFKETPIAPYVKVTAIVGDDFPIEKLKTSTAMTVTAEFANGKVYTLSGAWLASESALKNDDGTTELEFNGDRGIWQ